jgi:hypothetical protein
LLLLSSRGARPSNDFSRETHESTHAPLHGRDFSRETHESTHAPLHGRDR